MADVEDPCAASVSETHHSLRIAAVFIILATSLAGTLTPIALRKTSWIPVPVFEFAKFFGSGVIIATAFIHLLAPAFESLGSPCLTGVWQDYSWAPAIAMFSVYCIFFAEVASYRFGSARMERLGITYNTHNDAEAEHGHSHADPQPDHHNHHSSSDPQSTGIDTPTTALAYPRSPELGEMDTKEVDLATSSSASSLQDDGLNPEYDTSTAKGLGQLVAVAVLEFGVILHSFFIGLTLAVNEDFITLFVVIIFHQMFEGLGLGSRLSQLRLPASLSYAPYTAALVYAIMTPLGLAIGLGVRQSYNGNGAVASATSGVLDSISAGVLLYTGLVELLGHEILLNPKMLKASTGKLTYVFCCILSGSAIMALLGRWA